jgi:hypothetical protein
MAGDLAKMRRMLMEETSKKLSGETPSSGQTAKERWKEEQSTLRLADRLTRPRKKGEPYFPESFYRGSV